MVFSRAHPHPPRDYLRGTRAASYLSYKFAAISRVTHATSPTRRLKNTTRENRKNGAPRGQSTIHNSQHNTHGNSSCSGRDASMLLFFFFFFFVVSKAVYVPSRGRTKSWLSVSPGMWGPWGAAEAGADRPPADELREALESCPADFDTSG